MSHNFLFIHAAKRGQQKLAKSFDTLELSMGKVTYYIDEAKNS
jgi:hypothetical protein